MQIYALEIKGKNNMIISYNQKNDTLNFVVDVPIEFNNRQKGEELFEFSINREKADYYLENPNPVDYIVAAIRLKTIEKIVIEKRKDKQVNNNLISLIFSSLEKMRDEVFENIYIYANSGPNSDDDNAKKFKEYLTTNENLSKFNSSKFANMVDSFMEDRGW